MHYLYKIVIYIMCISDGRHEAVSFDKIAHRIMKLCYGLSQDRVDHVKHNLFHFINYRITFQFHL